MLAHYLIFHTRKDVLCWIVPVVKCNTCNIKFISSFKFIYIDIFRYMNGALFLVVIYIGELGQINNSRLAMGFLNRRVLTPELLWDGKGKHCLLLHCCIDIARLTRLGLSLFPWCLPGAVREIDGFATRQCITGEHFSLGNRFQNACVRH